jgi:broad-specificity NMP kinase
MAYLIAVTGLSGAGKTTAIDYLQKIGVGVRIYLGQSGRNDRPCTPSQLESRDVFEFNQLGIQKVIDFANFKIINEAGLDEFETQIRAFWNTVSANNF